MAETYTDSTGKVFPVNAFGRPQGYWDGNKFVFPKFGIQPAAAVPAVDPVTPAPVAPPVRQPGMVVPPPYVHDGDSQVPDSLGPLDRSAANNWGYANPFERGLLAAAIPGGALIGAGNNYEAMQMDRTGWGTQFSPGFFDVLTGGLFAGPGYDQSVLNMENRNIAGRPGFMGKSPFMDYTHQYGPNFMNDVKAYSPDYTTGSRSDRKSGWDVANIAAQQLLAAMDSRNAITIPDTLFMSGDEDFGGYGGTINEQAAGEMADDDLSGYDPFGDIADSLIGDMFGGGEDAPGDNGGFGEGVSDEDDPL